MKGKHEKQPISRANEFWSRMGPRTLSKRLCNASFAAVGDDDHCAIAIATVRVTPTDGVDISTSVETVSRDRRHNPVCSRATKF